MTENTTYPSNVMEHVEPRHCSWWWTSSVGGDKETNAKKKKNSYHSFVPTKQSIFTKIAPQLKQSKASRSNIPSVGLVSTHFKAWVRTHPKEEKQQSCSEIGVELRYLSSITSNKEGAPA
jgi:hypothetical protein